MQLAVISDIHGNVSALEAVLSDIDRRGIDRIVNLGDSLSGNRQQNHIGKRDCVRNALRLGLSI